MQHSVLDLEIYAKTVQTTIRRDVEKARQLDQAAHGGQVSRGGVALTFSRMFAVARSWLTGRRAVASAPGHAPPAHAPRPAVPRPVRAAEPYAGMVVVARAAALPIAERPCGMGER